MDVVEPWPISKKLKLDDDNSSGTIDAENKEKRVRKKMYALLMAYSGIGYLGLQRNMGRKTIEEDLMVALKKADILNEDEFSKQQYVHFQRAARTDKGVSALRQIISLEMKENVKPDEINAHLPDQIKILSVRRVTKGFNSKNSCDYRTYSYTCPTFAFSPKDIPISEDYRITDDVLEKITEIMQLCKGTHNFHNFTSGRRPMDPSCKRFIMDMSYKKPVIRDQLELTTFLVIGQSFMLHQIRKMMGVIISICKGYFTPDIIEKAYSPDERCDIPIAPGLGLLLEQVHYDWYNKKYGNNGFHESLEFTELEDDVEKFREQHIYPTIIRGEKEEKSMASWLEKLRDEHFSYQLEDMAEDDKILLNEETNNDKMEIIDATATKCEKVGDVENKQESTSTS